MVLKGEANTGRGKLTGDRLDMFDFSLAVEETSCFMEGLHSRAATVTVDVRVRDMVGVRNILRSTLRLETSSAWLLPALIYLRPPSIL